MAAGNSDGTARLNWLYALLLAVIAGVSVAGLSRMWTQGERGEAAIASIARDISTVAQDVAVLKSQVSTLLGKEVMPRGEILALIESKLLTSSLWKQDREEVMRRLAALEAKVNGK